MSYTYDSHNRLSTVVDNRLSGSNTTTFSYDSASNVTTVSYPNGAQSTFTYDTLDRFSGLSSQVSGYTRQRGPTGNLTGATESNGHTESWSHDGIYRLTLRASAWHQASLDPIRSSRPSRCLSGIKPSR